MEYNVARGASAKHLATIVQDEIAKGFRPVGGVFKAVDEAGSPWYQALTRSLFSKLLCDIRALYTEPDLPTNRTT
jgi:hypothetical protein